VFSKSRLDLVLIHPGSRTQIYQSLGVTLSAIEPPVWASSRADDHMIIRRFGDELGNIFGLMLAVAVHKENQPAARGPCPTDPRDFPLR